MNGFDMGTALLIVVIVILVFTLATLIAEPVGAVLEDVAAQLARWGRWVRRRIPRRSTAAEQTSVSYAHPQPPLQVGVATGVWCRIDHDHPDQRTILHFHPAVRPPESFLHYDARSHVEQFNQAAAAFAAAFNERTDKMTNSSDVTTGSVTRTRRDPVLTWSVGDVRPRVRPGDRGEFGNTQPERLEVRVMIPRSPSQAESEAERYGVVSASLTANEAETFALGLLQMVADIRVQQRTAAVDPGESAL